MNVINVGIHDKIYFYIKRGGLGVTHAIDCIFSYSDFVLRGTVDTGDVIEKMSKEVDKLVRKGTHPTLNPFMDDMLEMNQDGSLQKTIQKYITEKHTSKTEALDNQNDVMTIEAPFNLMMINVLPILEQKRIIIKKAVVQTPVTQIIIKED